MKRSIPVVLLLVLVLLGCAASAKDGSAPVVEKWASADGKVTFTVTRAPGKVEWPVQGQYEGVPFTGVYDVKTRGVSAGTSSGPVSGTWNEEKKVIELFYGGGGYHQVTECAKK